MQRRKFIALAVSAAAAWPLAARALTAEEAHNIALEAYIYFYPLVIMDVTRKHFTNIEAGKKFGRGPMNTFTHARTFPPATFEVPLIPISIHSIRRAGSI